MAAVYQDSVGLLGKEVAHSALDEIGLLVYQRGSRGRFYALLYLLPNVQQNVQVAHKVCPALALPGRADYHAHSFRNLHRPQNFLYSIALFSVLYFAGNSALPGVGHQDEIAAWNCYIRSYPRAFCANLSLCYLYDYLGSDWKFLGNILGGKFLGVFLLLLAAVFAHYLVGRVVGGGGEYVPIMQKSVLGLANIHKRRL